MTVSSAAGSTSATSQNPSYTGPSSISIGGTGAGGSSTSYNVDYHNGVPGIMGVDNQFIPFISATSADVNPGGTSGDNYTPAYVDITGSAPFGANQSYNFGTLTTQNPGGGSTNATYGTTPVGGYYVPTALQGVGQQSWWQSTGLPILEAASVVAPAAAGVGSTIASGGLGATDVTGATVGTAGTGATGATGVSTTDWLSINPTDPLGMAGTGTTAPLSGSSWGGTATAGAGPMNTASGLTGLGYGSATTGTGAVIDPTTGLPYGSISAGDTTASGVTGGAGIPNIPNVNTGNNQPSGGTNINLGGFGTAAEAAALLGITGYLGNKAQSDASTYSNMYKTIAAPMGQLATQTQQQAMTGQLQPWQTAMINQMVTNERAQASQFLSNATGTAQSVAGGGGPASSTAALDLGRQIDTNALIQAGQFQQTAVNQYLSEFGAYSSEMNLAVQAQIQGDQQLMQLWSNVMGSMAKGMFAGGGGGTPGSGGGGSGGGLNLGSIGSSLASLASNVGGGISSAVSSIFG